MLVSKSNNHQTFQKTFSKSRNGFILYVVLCSLILSGIFIFSLSRLQRGAVTQLARTTFQGRLSSIARSGSNEMWALIKAGINRPNSGIKPDFGNLFRSDKEKKKLISPTNPFIKEMLFNQSELPFTSEVAKEMLGDNVEMQGYCRIFFTDRLSTFGPSYSGHIEVICKVNMKSQPSKMIEVIERRDFKATDLRDFLDRYVLFVKDYCYDYNKLGQRLILNGINKKDHVSRAYLGNNLPPTGPLYKAPKSELEKIFLDINFTDDKKLIPRLITAYGYTPSNTTTEIAVEDASAKALSKGQVFWGLPNGLSFQSISQKAGFKDADFYEVKELQDAYIKTFVETAKKTPNNDNPHSIAYLILQDWKKCGGNFPKSEVFRMVVQTSIKSWKYHYGYTDVLHLWQNGKWTDFGRRLHFSGATTYLKKMEGYFPDKKVSGKMAMFFGKDRNIPIIIEGNVFLRFFKISLLDSYSASITLGGTPYPIGMRAIPLHFSPKKETNVVPINPNSDPASFLNKKIAIDCPEKSLMSRPIETVPANKLFSSALSLKPKAQVQPKWIFPQVDPKTRDLSYRYKTSADFLSDRLSTDADGTKVLDIDGKMFIEQGNLDISKITRFKGRGMIWIGFKGNCYIGDLAKTSKLDSLKIWLQDGNFLVKSPKSSVTINASLIALAFSKRSKTSKSTKFHGKLIPNKHGVTIVGNLAVDYLFLADKNFGIPSGQNLTIVHDRNIYSPSDSTWVSLGQIRTANAITADPSTSFFGK